MLHNTRHGPLPRKPHPKFKQLGKRKRVTLIVGFRCGDGVVVCADSQETLGQPTPDGYAAYRCKVDKLQPRTETDGAYHWVAGGCGDGDLVDGFIDRLKEVIAGWSEGLSGAAMKERLRQSLLDYRRNEVAASGLASDPLEFLVCIKPRSEGPFLFKAARTVRVVTDWSMIGWDEGIYRHDIERHYKPNQNTSFSMLLGAHVLLLAKSTSNNIGGPTKIVIGNDAGLRALSEPDVAELEKRVTDFDSALDALRLRMCDTAVPLDEFTRDLSGFHEAVVDLRVTLTHDIILAKLRRLGAAKTAEDALLLDDPYLSLPSPEECLRALRATWASATASRKTKRGVAITNNHISHAAHLLIKINGAMYKTGSITKEQRIEFATRLGEINEDGIALLNEAREITSHEPLLETEVDNHYASLTEKVVDPLLSVAADFCKLFETDDPQAYRIIGGIQAAFLSIFVTALVAPLSEEPKVKQLEGKINSESGSTTLT